MKSKGFTLLEVIAAIFVLTVGAGAAFTLIQQTLISTSLVEDRFIASYLIQEGIEIVKNIRDTNWLEEDDWDEGLNTSECQNGCEADYTFTSQPDPSLPAFGSGRFLNIDGDDFYSYSAGTATKFKRKITISDGGEPDKMKVSVQVSWLERGRTHSLEALEYITNYWRK